MLIGYARVSTHDQDTTAQASALKAAGSERRLEAGPAVPFLEGCADDHGANPGS
jgi:DNA invertase Pin-like site-specific DNA recombinase